MPDLESMIENKLIEQLAYNGNLNKRPARKETKFHSRSGQLKKWINFNGRCDSHGSHLPRCRAIYFATTPFI